MGKGLRAEAILLVVIAVFVAVSLYFLANREPEPTKIKIDLPAVQIEGGY